MVDTSEAVTAGAGPHVTLALSPSQAGTHTCLILLVTFQWGISRTPFVMRCDIFAISRLLVLLSLPL